MSLKFKVVGQSIKAISIPNNITLSNRIKCEFVLDGTWNDDVIYVIFNGNNITKNVQLVDNKCLVPIEVFGGSYIDIGLYVEDIHTTTSERIYIHESCYKDNIDINEITDTLITNERLYTNELFSITNERLKIDSDTIAISNERLKL